jgi:hypothetical protein
VVIPTAADAAAGSWHGTIISSGDAVLASGVETANTTYVAKIEGTIIPSANGNISLAHAGEIATTLGVRLMPGSNARLVLVA